MDLKRMRNDVERLTAMKDSLQQKVAHSDREKQDLTDNFMYVKGELDKVQMRQSGLDPGHGGYGSSSSSSSSGGSAQEIGSLREQLQKLSEDRNRMNQRIESLCRDLEKHKTSDESSMERVMTANARLL